MLKCEVMLSYEDPRAAWIPGLDAFEQGYVLRGRKFFSKTVESAKKKAFLIIRKSRLLKSLTRRKKKIEWCSFEAEVNKSIPAKYKYYRFGLNSKFLDPQEISNLKMKDAKKLNEIEFWVKR